MTAKWESKTLDEGFIPFPKRLLRCQHLIFSGEKGVEELAVVLAIVDFKRPNLLRQPSLSYLAFLSGLSVEVFKERLQELIERGLVSSDKELKELDDYADEVALELHGLESKIRTLTSHDEEDTTF